MKTILEESKCSAFNATRKHHVAFTLLCTFLLSPKETNFTVKCSILIIRKWQKHLIHYCWSHSLLCKIYPLTGLFHHIITQQGLLLKVFESVTLRKPKRLLRTQSSLTEIQCSENKTTKAGYTSVQLLSGCASEAEKIKRLWIKRQNIIFPLFQITVCVCERE